MICQALSGTLWSMVPLAVAVATFTVFVLTGNTLDVSTALTSLALFEILRFPLFMLPNVVNNLVEANISITRIEAFLDLDERVPVPPLDDPATPAGVVVDNATFIWEGKRQLSDADEDDDELTPEAWENHLLRAQLADANLQVKR